jgi:hypothetical protein
VLLVVAIAVIVVVAVALAVVLSRRSKLRPLPEESRDRYARSWRAVENRFIDDPTGAVSDADRMVVMMLSERGATLSDPRTVPEDLRKAREAASGDKSPQGTEAMRIALVHYKRMVDDGVGVRRPRREVQRREVAS